MDADDKTRLSNFLSLVLRQKPETLGLKLDPEGWVRVSTLLQAAKATEPELTREALLEIVKSPDEQRFALSVGAEKIRAIPDPSPPADPGLKPQAPPSTPDPSPPADPGLKPQAPPATLYHGTTAGPAAKIKEEGLKKMAREHVQLSPDEVTARIVGGRRGRPVVLVIDAAKMQADGHSFFLSDNGVWLTDAVPAAYISGWDS